MRLGEEMMAELGYEPVGFASSAAALETFRATPQRFDAVLSDEAMPEHDGLGAGARDPPHPPRHPDRADERLRDAGAVGIARAISASSKCWPSRWSSRDIARSLAGALRR